MPLKLPTLCIIRKLWILFIEITITISAGVNTLLNHPFISAGDSYNYLTDQLVVDDRLHVHSNRVVRNALLMETMMLHLTFRKHGSSHYLHSLVLIVNKRL